MPNHYHLVVETPDADLSRGMQQLNGAYAQAFNEQHSLDGHLLTRYLAINPVAGGLCAHPADWPWGSYAAAIGATSSSFVAVEELLRCFSPNPTRARRALRSFVGDRS
jgi:putative transposase